MLLIPAIDLKEGRCVRLKQGRMEDATLYSDDPAAMAERWRDAGCRRLHVVDLDAAFAGAPRNHRSIAEIVRRVQGVPVQVGGGIRSLADAAKYLDAGVEAVIVGTAAVRDFDFLTQLAARFPKRILFGLDARQGRAATDGWDLTTERSAMQLARAADGLPLAGIVHTDIERDGMLTGINIGASLDLAKAVSAPVIASGGLHDLDELARLKAADDQAGGLLLGTITGRAIYAGTLDFRQGQALLDA